MKTVQLRTSSSKLVVGVILAAGASAIEVTAQDVGAEGMRADQRAFFVQQGTHLGSNSIDITPSFDGAVANCIPFGNNTGFGFTGFIYRNVPSFSLQVGQRFAFDLGAQNDVDTRRNIYFGIANKNPLPIGCDGHNNTISQDIRALGWTQVVSDSQTPLNPRGNTVKHDYELIYRAEAPFSFPGGGFVVGLGASPPGAFMDSGCEQVLVLTNCLDPSGFFHARFFLKPDQTLGTLDDISDGGSGLYLGGIVIETTTNVTVDIKPGSDPNSINCRHKGVVPVAILTTSRAMNDAVDFDASTVDPSTVKFGLNGVSAVHRDGHIYDVDGDGDLDMVLHFRQQATGIACGDKEACLTGETTDGTSFEGCDTVRTVGSQGEGRSGAAHGLSEAGRRVRLEGGRSEDRAGND